MKQFVKSHKSWSGRARAWCRLLLKSACDDVILNPIVK